MVDKVIPFPVKDGDGTGEDEAGQPHVFDFLDGTSHVVDDCFLLVTPTFAAAGKAGTIYYAAAWPVLKSVGRVV